MPDAFGYTEPETARQLGIGERTLRRWRQAGAIGFSITPGGRIRYTTEDIYRLRAGMIVAPRLGKGAGSVA